MLPLGYTAFNRHVCNELLYVWPTFNNYPESSQSLLRVILGKEPSLGGHSCYIESGLTAVGRLVQGQSLGSWALPLPDLISPASTPEMQELDPGGLPWQPHSVVC